MNIESIKPPGGNATGMPVNGMDPSLQERFRNQLWQMLEDLSQRAGSTLHSLQHPPESQADLVDLATYEHQSAFTARIRDRESRLMNKIKIALQKLDDNEYGICEECGDDISIQRLLARPVTAYCIRCKTRMEEMEKSLGL